MKDEDEISYIELEPIVRTGIARAVISTRIGGVSLPPYHELNLGLNVGDDPMKVKENRDRFASAVNIKLESLKIPRQMHSADCFGLVRSGEKPPKCDGLVTNLKDVTLGVLTADCVPVILIEPVSGVIGIAHAGWRGTLAGISQNTLNLMIERFEVNPVNCLAIIGPSIGRCCYEVSEDLISKFKSRFGREISSSRHVDLPLANALLLIRGGVPEENIWICQSCTACREDLFFSHRRDGVTGRMLSLIGRGGMKDDLA